MGKCSHVVHKLGRWCEFWKGPFCIENIHLNMNQPFQIETGILWTKNIMWAESVLFVKWVINPCFPLLRLLNNSNTIQTFLLFFLGFKSECTVSNKIFLHTCCNTWLILLRLKHHLLEMVRDYHFSISLMQNWHRSVCCIIMPHHDESDESIVQFTVWCEGWQTSGECRVINH